MGLQNISLKIYILLVYAELQSLLTGNVISQFRGKKMFHLITYCTER